MVKLEKPVHEPIVEGTMYDDGLVDFGHVDEMCPHCLNDVFNIPADRVSLCPSCEGEIFPCSGCADVQEGRVLCDFGSKTQGCHRFMHSEPKPEGKTYEGIGVPETSSITWKMVHREPIVHEDFCGCHAMKEWHFYTKSVHTGVFTVFSKMKHDDAFVALNFARFMRRNPAWNNSHPIDFRYMTEDIGGTNN